jgi:hypothetical protein
MPPNQTVWSKLGKECFCWFVVDGPVGIHADFSATQALGTDDHPRHFACYIKAVTNGQIEGLLATWALSVTSVGVFPVFFAVTDEHGFLAGSANSQSYPVFFAALHPKRCSCTRFTN